MTTAATTPSARERRIWDALAGVPDPEIPPLSIVELGMIAAVRVAEDHAEVDMTPTFAGCPALALIREEIERAVHAAGEHEVVVNTVFDPPWTTERISEVGRRKLKEFGLAPPGRRCAGDSLPDIELVPCPHCDSTETDLESIFGPTLCRSIHYCRTCRQSFEHFKAV